ncbi:MAG: hypothetical protein RR036_00300 [Oscillospiraceae bacterium]
MTTQEYLSRANGISVEIKALTIAKQNAKDAATRCSNRISSQPNAHSDVNASEKKYVKFCELSILLDKKIAQLSDVKVQIIAAINTAPDPTLRALLIHRYINAKTWEQIAEYLDKSDKWVRTKMHENALNAVKIPMQ